MGLMLDVMCACALSFLLSMLAFLSITRNAAVAALLSILAGACVGVISHRLLKKKSRLTRRRKRLLADRYIKSMCFMDADKAHAEAFKLLSGKYPLSDAAYENGRTRFTHARQEQAILVVLQKLKSSPDDLLSAWRAHGRLSGVNSMVAVVPGRSEQDIRVTAFKLKQPGVVVIDRRQLRALAKKYAPLRDTEAKHARPHPLRALSAFVTRRRAGRYLLYAVMLNAYYLITGSLFYLAASVALIAVSAVSLRKQAQPDKLI